MTRHFAFLTVLVALTAISRAQSPGNTLPAPTGLEASDGAYSTKVGIAWDHIRGAKTYRILRGTTNDSASATPIGATESLIFYDLNAQPNQSYFYWVRAENGNLQSPLSASDQGFRALGRSSGFGHIAPLPPPPVPAENPVTGAKIYLGKTLFWDEQLSSTRTVACGTCHRPRTGGTDTRSELAGPNALNPGPDGAFGTADDITGSPGVPLNRADGSYQFSPIFGMRPQVTHRKAQSVFEAAYADEGILWDGRAAQQFVDPATGAVIIQTLGALESQALLPLTNTAEMSHRGATLGNVVARIAASRPLALSPSIPPALAAWIGGRAYPELFAEAFGTPGISAARVAMAIASYERTLYSDRTPIDQAAADIRPLPQAEERGHQVYLNSFCTECHRGTQTSDNRFRYIGVRPVDDDIGRSEVTGKATDLGRFRTPSLRNVGVRAPYMHNGGFSTLEEVVEFYDRGGDFTSSTKDTNFVTRLRLSAKEKSDLVAFLRNGLTDPRVAAEAGPLFDRPMLYSESSRVPQITGSGTSGSSGAVPQMHAIEPPVAGNPSFTVGVSKALGGAQAVLVVDESPPPAGPAIPSTGSFTRASVRTEGSGAAAGFASISLKIPNDPDLAGRTLFGRWYVSDPEAAGGVASSPAFRMTVFGAAPAPPPVSVLTSVSAASQSLGFVAPESIVSGYGPELAASTGTAASTPLPTTVAGVSVRVTDGQASQRLAPLFYVSPTQINYLLPPGTATGEATISVLSNGAAISTGTAQVTPVAPSLFAANGGGTGVAAALVLRITDLNLIEYQPVAEFDPNLGRSVPLEIDLGPENQQVILLLFGTGIRFGNLAQVSATIGGEPADVLSAGPQPEFVGLDQVNVRLARVLAGKGDVDISLTVDGQRTNAVRIRIR